MNYRQLIKLKKKERDSLANFLRDYENKSVKKNDEPLTMEGILKLCGQVEKLNSEIKKLESKPMSFIDKDVIQSTIEIPSKLNLMKETRYNFQIKKTKPLPVIKSNWERTL